MLAVLNNSPAANSNERNVLIMVLSIFIRAAANRRLL
jgi:hypothetical protein